MLIQLIIIKQEIPYTVSLLKEHQKRSWLYVLTSNIMENQYRRLKNGIGNLNKPMKNSEKEAKEY
jgi:hypothetical protein